MPSENTEILDFNQYENSNKTAFIIYADYNTISLSCHGQVCLSGLRFQRYFSHHRKRSPLKHTCS